MNISSNEVKKEVEHLESTKEIIRDIIQSKEAKIEKYKTDIVDTKKYIWNNTHEMSDPEMYNAMDDEDLRVSIINDDIIKVAKLYRSLENPYFGKVVFDGEEIYVGLTGVDRDNENYVYDWRAPISNLYYNFEVGNAHYDTPNGTVTGEISSKRQYKIEMGKLIDAFDNDISIDDEVLQEVLLSSSSDKMKNIVNTIQKEQNEVIRYKGKRHLIIQGVAGSGKTSVALHRIAYLIYNMGNLSSSNIIIFSPNEVFSNYISNVLPELGENNVLTTTWSNFTKKYIPGIEVESLSSFIERYYKNKEGLDREIEYKLSSSYIELIKEFLSDFINGLSFKKSLGLKKVEVTKEELDELLHSKSKRLSLSDRIDYITEELCNRFLIDSKKNSSKLRDIVMDILDIKYSPIELYKLFIESNLYKDKFKSEVNLDYIRYEDISGLMYLYFEVYGYPIVSHIKQVVIDEAQDYNLVQFEFMKKIFKNASFTILGDKNQVINPYHKYETLEEIASIYKDSKYVELRNTYRSSSEIIEYTNKILGLEGIKSIRRKTKYEVIERVETDIKNDLLRDIKYLEDEGFKRIALITKTNSEAFKLNELIGNKKIGLITDSILKSVVILPSYLSKGLEFDAVIAYNDPKDKYTEEEKYLLYVVLTRAEHALIRYNK